MAQENEARVQVLVQTKVVPPCLLWTFLFSPKEVKLSPPRAAVALRGITDQQPSTGMSKNSGLEAKPDCASSLH